MEEESNNVGDDHIESPLPILNTIWDCPMMNKVLIPGPGGSMVCGWTCGWCPVGRAPFKGGSAPRALAHVAKVSGVSIWFCDGSIPIAKIRQYWDLHLSKMQNKSEKEARKTVLYDTISNLQARTQDSLGRECMDNKDGGDTMDSNCLLEPPRKCSPPDEVSTSTIGSLFSHKAARAPQKKQLKLCANSNAIDLHAPEQLHVAIADFIHSNCLPFSLAEDPKFLKVIEIAKTVGRYSAPTRQSIGGRYLDALHEINWKEQMKSLLCEASTFGITVFGDGATIKTVPLLNVLAAGVNNPFALLDIADCTNHLAQGGMKDAKHIANIIHPLIAQLESEVDDHNRLCFGIVDLVFFDGASNVQNAGELLRVKHPRITVGHGAEHVVSLFFSDVYKKASRIQNLAARFNIIRPYLMRSFFFTGA